MYGAVTLNEYTSRKEAVEHSRRNPGFFDSRSEYNKEAELEPLDLFASHTKNIYLEKRVLKLEKQIEFLLSRMYYTGEHLEDLKREVDENFELHEKLESDVIKKIGEVEGMADEANSKLWEMEQEKEEEDSDDQHVSM
jgi:hypothetical protein